MLERTVSLGTVLAISLALSSPLLREQSNEAPFTNSNRSIEEIVTWGSSAAQREFPTARLFQVSILGVVPKALEDGTAANSSVESSYFIGSQDKYVQVIQASGPPPKGAPVVIQKSAKREQCNKGYPFLGAEVCAQELGTGEEQSEQLNVQALSELIHLSRFLSSAGMNPSHPVNITLTTTARLAEVLKLSQSAGSDQVSERLASMPPAAVIISVTGLGGDQNPVGSTIYLDAANGALLGKSEAAHPPRLPPSQRR